MLFWCQNNPFCLKDEFLSLNWEILKKGIFWSKMSFFSQKKTILILLLKTVFSSFLATGFLYKLKSTIVLKKMNSEPSEKKAVGFLTLQNFGITRRMHLTDFNIMFSHKFIVVSDNDSNLPRQNYI